MSALPISTPHVRPATEADLPALRQLWQRLPALQTAYPMIRDDKMNNAIDRGELLVLRDLSGYVMYYTRPVDGVAWADVLFAEHPAGERALLEAVPRPFRVSTPVGDPRGDRLAFLGADIYRELDASARHRALVTWELR